MAASIDNGRISLFCLISFINRRGEGVRLSDLSPAIPCLWATSCRQVRLTLSQNAYETCDLSPDEDETEREMLDLGST